MDIIFDFFTSSINLTNKTLSNVSILNFLYKKYQNRLTVILMLLYFLFVSLIFMYISLNESFSIFTILWSIVSAIALLLVIPTFGNVIVEFSPDREFDLKRYDLKFFNNKFVAQESPSPLIKRKEKEECPNQRKPVKDWEPNSRKSYSKNDVNFGNRPARKSGPGNIYYKYFAIKYYLIQHFYAAERIETEKYASAKDFYSQVGKIENINAGSFKSQFSRIKYEPDFRGLVSKNKEIIKLLQKNNELRKYPLADKFAKDFVSE